MSSIDQLESKFGLFLEAAPDALVIVDQEGTMVLVNRQTEKLFNYKREQLIGQKVEMLIPERVRQPHTAHRVDYGKAPKVREMGAGMELAGRRSEGSEFPVEISLSPLKLEEGNWTMAAIRDITERKRVHEELAARTEELARTNEELEAFSYTVAHDLRAPLRSVAGFSQLLERYHSTSLDKEAREYLGLMCESVQQMDRLIEDLLSLARVSRVEMRRSQVDLTRIVREIAARLHAAAPQRAVKWIIKEGLVAEGDQGLLTVAMENLLGNAWKYSGKKDSAEIEFGCTRKERTVFFVRDNGAGFDMALADKLFKPFQRLHSPRDFEGTGIGLATVKRIIGRHGGKVWVESKAGEGATFYFYLSSGRS